MKMRKLFYSLLLMHITSSFTQDQIVCMLGNKSVNDCVKAALSENFIKLHNPNKKASFDSIDPFWFQFRQLNFNGTDRVLGNFTVKNVTLYGGKHLLFEKLSIKSNTKQMLKIFGSISISIVKFDGYYDTNLKIGEFKVASEGSMNGTFENLSGKFTAIGNLIDSNDGLSQLNITNFDIQLIIKNMKLKIIGLSKDDNLNTLVNRIVNDSWQFLYQDLIQVAKTFWQDVVIDLFNEFFGFVKLKS